MSELLWIRQFLSKLTIEISLTMEMKLDNQAMIHITTNPVFHEWTKHIGVSYHLIPEKKKIISKETCTSHTRSTFTFQLQCALSLTSWECQISSHQLEECEEDTLLFKIYSLFHSYGRLVVICFLL